MQRIHIFPHLKQSKFLAIDNVPKTQRTQFIKLYQSRLYFGTFAWAYIKAGCEPNINFPSYHLVQYGNPNEQKWKKLKKDISVCKCFPNQGFTYVAVSSTNLTVRVFIAAVFKADEDFTSQIGAVMVLMDHTHTTNIVHYGSCKWKCSTRIV